MGIKTSLAFFMVLFILLAFPMAGSWAGTPTSPAFSGKAVTSPLGNPNPTIAIATKTPVVNAGVIPTGNFFVTIEFTIGANLEKVSMYLEASDLYKNGNPMDPDKAGPISLNTGRPAEIITQFGRQYAGSSGPLWSGTGNPISGFPTKKTQTVTYESGQKGQFSQDVTCKIWYNRPIAEKSAGQYSGKVRLTAMINP